METEMTKPATLEMIERWRPHILAGCDFEECLADDAPDQARYCDEAVASSVFLLALIDQQAAEIARKDAALREYGHHYATCHRFHGGRPCNCGFDAALAGEKEAT
jgi:hypothetical protein